MSTFFKFFSTIFLICLISSHYAQQDTLKYWIQFSDKLNSVYNVDNPSDFLSERAIQRRKKSNIPITEEDLPVNRSYIDSLLIYPSVRLLNTSRWFNAVTISCWDTNDINAINKLPFVTQSQIVMRRKIDKINPKFEEIDAPLSTKITPLFSNTPKYPYGLNYNQIRLHNMDYLHEMGHHGEGIHIAVIDAGFENVHNMRCFDHLFDEGRLLSYKDFVDHDGDVFWDHPHGTVVLSTMAAVIPGRYFGTATKASYHLLRSEAADYEHIVEEDNWVAAAEYADSAGVDIINTSLGYTEFDDPTQNHTYSDLDGNTTRIAIASNIAANKGILLVTSAGNQGMSAWKYISTPGDASLILTVGAVDSLGNYAPFSSVGPNSAGEIKPNVASVGWHCYVVLPWDEGITRANGTSFSSPMIAGMAASLWSALPHFNNFELKNLIESVSHQYHQPDSLMGYGIPDFYEAYKQSTGLTYPIQEGIELVTQYPNPISDHFNLLLRSDRNQKVTLMAYDLKGKILYEEAIKIERGMNKIETNEVVISSGLYFLRIQDETGKEFHLKIVKR
jgi:hypothetical protein